MNLDQQVALHYEELKQVAHRLLRQRHATLQTTALVHELFLKLRHHAGTDDDAHLMNLAARAMRQILVDAARRRASEKRGGDQIGVTLTGSASDGVDGMSIDVLALEQALHKLEKESPELAQVVELHFYGGLSFPEMSRLLGLTERTLFRYWRTARAQIHLDLGGAAT